MGKDNKIVLYQVDDTNVCVDVMYQNETFWLSQKAMAELFDVNVPAISKHLNNIYDEEELSRDLTVSKMEIVQKEGNRNATIDKGYCRQKAEYPMWMLWIRRQRNTKSLG